MKNYEHDTILFKKNGYLKTKVSVGTPAYVVFSEKIEDVSGTTTIKYIALNSVQNDKDRVETIISQFDWDNNGRNVVTEVYDLMGSMRSTNTIHTNKATQY
ncbi:MAG: hypothetical protein B6D61_02640 [Bacteroidetes bacterium 4484_249]|nr:MAG: hypothetical protein B6D61_02640 [Bacteroidetes bacterium 4484_249]